jgi:hypothetical protein
MTYGWQRLTCDNRSVSVQPFHALLYPLDPMTMLAVARAAAADVEKAVAHASPLQVEAVCIDDVIAVIIITE